MKKMTRSVRIAQLCVVLVATLRLLAAQAHASARKEGDKDPQEEAKKKEKKAKEAKEALPAGYSRSKDGVLVRTDYNLSRRFYLGGAWAPGVVSGTWTGGRGLLEIGSDLEWVGTMYEHADFMKMRFNPGSFGPGRRLTVETADYLYVARKPMELFKVDVPLVPWGHEVKMRAGLMVRFPSFSWFQVGPSARENVLFFDWITPRFVVDLWQSDDSRSHLRVGAGAGLTGRMDSTAWNDFPHYVSPVGLVAYHTRSKGGLHNLDLNVSAEPMFGLTNGQRHSRIRANATYEVVLFAINEQPFSFYSEARYDYNDAVGLGYNPHEATFMLGARISFGAK